MKHDAAHDAFNTRVPALAAVSGGPALYLQKKARKLTTAIYLVTGQIPESEPIRQSVRARAVSFLTDISKLHRLEQDRRALLEEIGSHVSCILDLLEVLSHTGYLSHENAELLRNEFEGLALFVDERQHSIRSDATLPEDALSVPYEESVFESVRTTKGQKDTTTKGHTKGHLSDTRMSDMKKTAASAAASPKKQEREHSIIELVKKAGRVNVRDVATTITDCSEKTLQRELLRLVDMGVLKKEGERRWSTYCLA